MPNKGRHIMNSGGSPSRVKPKKEDIGDRIAGYIVLTSVALFSLPFVLGFMEWVIYVVSGQSFGISARLLGNG